MSRPRLLDAFCGAGGAARGYVDAGFDVVGVDLSPQPRYPFEFHQGDALHYLAEHWQEFDAIHASPPCQAHTSLKDMHNAKQHTDLIPATRGLLELTGLPWVIENVPGAPLRSPIVLCGTAFGLGCDGAELRRHRLFETNWSWHALIPPCGHNQKPRVIGVYGGHGRDRRRTTKTQDFTTEQRRQAMGIDWMTGAELSQAIPPRYAHFIGEQLLDQITHQDIPA